MGVIHINRMMAPAKLLGCPVYERLSNGRLYVARRFENDRLSRTVDIMDKEGEVTFYRKEYPRGCWLVGVYGKEEVCTILTHSEFKSGYEEIKESGKDASGGKTICDQDGEQAPGQGC